MTVALPIVTLLCFMRRCWPRQKPVAADTRYVKYDEFGAVAAADPIHQT